MLLDEITDDAVAAGESLGDDRTMQNRGFEAAILDTPDQIGLERIEQTRPRFGTTIISCHVAA